MPISLQFLPFPPNSPMSFHLRHTHSSPSTQAAEAERQRKALEEREAAAAKVRVTARSCAPATSNSAPPSVFVVAPAHFVADSPLHFFPLLAESFHSPSSTTATPTRASRATTPTLKQPSTRGASCTRWTLHGSCAPEPRTLCTCVPPTTGLPTPSCWPTDPPTGPSWRQPVIHRSCQVRRTQ